MGTRTQSRGRRTPLIISLFRGVTHSVTAEVPVLAGRSVVCSQPVDRPRSLEAYFFAGSGEDRLHILVAHRRQGCGHPPRIAVLVDELGADPLDEVVTSKRC